MTELPPPRYVDTATELGKWARHCASAQYLAVDTESDSFHHYREKVCLVQMSAKGEDAIIDPLALDDLEPLSAIFANAAQIKIFHDACYDLVCLRRDFGISVAGLHDTMWASRLLGHRNFGLANILAERFGYQANKRLQRSDWTRRPLSAEQLTYARHDTHFLERLAIALTGELRAAGRLEWALEDFARLPEIAARIVPPENRADPEGFWRIRGVRSLPSNVLGRVRALYAAREKIAQRLDRPRFKVLGDKVLLDLAINPPRSIEALRPRPGLRRGGIERFGPQLIQALHKATPANDPPPPKTRRRRSGRFLDPLARKRYELLRQLRRAKAEDLGLEPEVLLGNAALEELARLPRARREEARGLSELCGWRGPLLADAVVSVLGQETPRTKGRDRPAR